MGHRCLSSVYWSRCANRRPGAGPCIGARSVYLCYIYWRSPKSDAHRSFSSAPGHSRHVWTNCHCDRGIHRDLDPPLEVSVEFLERLSYREPTFRRSGEYELEEEVAMFEPKNTSSLSLEEKIQLLMDERDIRNVIDRLSRAASRADLELYKTCFHDDAVIRNGPTFDGKVSDFFEKFADTDPKVGEAPPPYMTNTSIDFDGNL